MRSAWQILQSLSDQQKFENTKFNKAGVDKQIAIGINQLDTGQGTDFDTFLNETQADYGSKQ